MGKIVIIFVVIFVAITSTILSNINTRSEEIPEMLSTNFQDIGSYALQFGINQVVKGSIKNDVIVTYTGVNKFDVLDGAINNIEYRFKSVTTDAEYIEDDPYIEGEDEGTFVYDIAGTLNINPGNSSNNEFQMETPTGYIDRAQIHKNAPEFSYTGPATVVRVKPKAQGRTVYINGVAIELNTNARYTITSNSMTVNLWNDHIKHGKAMGHWWITIDAINAVLELDPGIPLEDFVIDKSWNKEETFTHTECTIIASVSMHVNNKTTTHGSTAEIVVVYSENEDVYWWTINEEESSYKIVYWNP